MSEVTTARVSYTSDAADAMLKRVFKAAEILATVKQSKNFPTDAAENRTKNRLHHESRYRKD